jgi:hypothetical protein
MREKVSAAEKIEEKLRGYERKLQEMNQLKQQLTVRIPYMCALS